MSQENVEIVRQALRGVQVAAISMRWLATVAIPRSSGICLADPVAEKVITTDRGAGLRVPSRFLGRSGEELALRAHGSGTPGDR